MTSASSPTSNRSAAADRDAAREDHRVASDLRAEQAQIEIVERRAGEGDGGRGAHEGLGRPEAEIARAPKRNRPRAHAADQQPLAEDGERVVAEEPQDRDRERAAVERDRRVDRLVDPVERGLAGGDREGADDRIKRRLRRAAGVIGEVRRTMRRTNLGGLRLGRPLGVERAGKPADRRVGVDVAHGDLQRRVELAHARAEARHEERVRAVFGEDVGVDRDRLETQHALERLAKLPLGLGLGRNDLVVEPQPGRLRGRQELAIGLVADQRRNERQAFEIGRRHVGRQALAHVRDDRRRVRRGCAVLDRIIGDEFGRAGLGLEGRRDRLGDLRNLDQDRLDLGEFDAIAAQFDLRVDAAEILDLAVLGEAAEVAGAIDAARRIVRQGEEVPDELRLGELRPVEIALGDADAGDADLARLAAARPPCPAPPRG